MTCQRRKDLALLVDHYEGSGDSGLIQKLQCISSACDDICSFHHEYDFRDVQANGFRSFVKKADLFFHNMSQLVVSGRRSAALDGYEKLASTFVKQVQILKLIREKDENGPHDKTQIHYNDAIVQHMLICFTDDELRPLFTTPGAFWLEPIIDFGFRSVLHVIVFLNASLSNKIKLLSSPSLLTEGVMKVIHNMDVPRIRNFSDTASIFPFSVMAGVTKYFGGNAGVYVPVKLQCKWRMKLDGTEELVQLVHEAHDSGNSSDDEGRSSSHAVTSDSVNCLIIHPNQRTSETLIFQVHGSGYVGMRPTDHEVYLREWSKELGVSVIAPDYSKAPEKPYPCGLQDLLHVYLNVTGEKGQQILGFKPKKVIVTGDSAGGNLAMALIFALNEIRGRGHDVHMPSGVNLHCPLANALSYPCSHGQTCLDLFLPSSMTVTIATGYAVSDPPTKSLWFREEGVDVHAVREQIERFVARVKDPFLNLNAYEKWDQLADIVLMIQTGEFDALLDDSIDIAKRWTGPVTLDVMEHMPHTYLLIPSARKEARLTIQRLRQLIDPSAGKQSETWDMSDIVRQLLPSAIFSNIQQKCRTVIRSIFISL